MPSSNNSLADLNAQFMHPVFSREFLGGEIDFIGFELMLKVEAHPGIEPSYKDLQSSA